MDITKFNDLGDFEGWNFDVPDHARKYAVEGAKIAIEQVMQDLRLKIHGEELRVNLLDDWDTDEVYREGASFIIKLRDIKVVSL